MTSAPAQRPSPPVSAERWVIQVGVFSTSQRAAIVVERLTALGYPAFEREHTFVARGPFRVAFAGPFDNKEQADAALVAVRRVPDFEDAMLRPLPAS